MSVAALGVDVVDLVRSHRRDVPSARFVERVYSPEERALLSANPRRPDLPWILWAGKEAAFKALTLQRGEAPVFTHADFRVALDEVPDAGDGAADPLRGRVRWHGRELILGGSLSTDRVVAWAVPDPSLVTLWRWGTLDDVHLSFGGGTLDQLTSRGMSAREAAPVHSVASAVVRLAVRRDAAAWLETAEDRLEVVCAPGPRGRVPPRLHRDGEPLRGVGLSISHHGRWLAWGVAGQRSGGR